MGLDELKKKSQIHKLNDFESGTVFELMTSKKIDTVNGEAYLVDFSTEVDGNTIEGRMILPLRMKTDIEGKTPTIVLYGGKKMSNNKKEYQDTTFFEVEKTSAKQTGS